MAGVIIISILCFVFRLIEYFVLHTDRTIIGEAIFHKLIGIVIMIIAARGFGYTLKDIGFKGGKSLWNILKGLAFGIGAFVIAYTTEVLINMSNGLFKTLDVYVSAYAVDKNLGNRTELIFFLICILGNIINVLMEEGMFRGLFMRMLEEKRTFMNAAVISSLLFGFWHIVGPVRNYVEGESSLTGLIVNSLILVASSALVGLKFTMLKSLTGSLYFAMGDHFVNNTIVNLLHVVSDTGADEMMMVRVTIAQTISFIAVLVWYIAKRRNDAANHAPKAGYREP